MVTFFVETSHRHRQTLIKERQRLVSGIDSISQAHHDFSMLLSRFVLSLAHARSLVYGLCLAEGPGLTSIRLPGMEEDGTE